MTTTKYTIEIELTADEENILLSHTMLSVMGCAEFVSLATISPNNCGYSKEYVDVRAVEYLRDAEATKPVAADLWRVLRAAVFARQRKLARKKSLGNG